MEMIKFIKSAFLILGLFVLFGCSATTLSTQPTNIKQDESILQAVPNEYRQKVKTALLNAGTNKPELIKAIEQCDKKYLSAMCFLISQTPYRYFYRTPLDKYKDSETITADILLAHIKLGYQAKENFPWATDLDADIFQKFVLSYRNTTEKLVDWRTYFWNHSELRPIVDKYSALYKNATTKQGKDKIFKELIYNLNTKWVGSKVPYAPRGMPDMNPIEAIEAKTGRCTDETNTIIAILRTFGIAATGVRCVLWADNSGNHTWTAVYNPITKEWLNIDSGQGGDLNDPNYFRAFVMTTKGKIPKIYWVTPGEETGKIFTTLTPQNDEVIPYNIEKYLIAKPMVDKTDLYTKTTTLKKEGLISNTLVWLMPTNADGVVAGKRSDKTGTVTFEKVGCNISYRLLYCYQDGFTLACENILRIDENGEVTEKQPEIAEKASWLNSMAVQKMERNQLSDALVILKEAVKLKPDDSSLLYNLACIYSLLNNKEEALNALEQAVKAGWNNFTHMQNDTDLENIKGEERFKKLIAH